MIISVYGSKLNKIHSILWKPSYISLEGISKSSDSEDFQVAAYKIGLNSFMLHVGIFQKFSNFVEVIYIRFMFNATPAVVLSDIKIFMMERRITKKELSKILGYKSPQSAVNLLKSERYLTKEQADILSKKYGFNRDYLTNGVGTLWDTHVWGENRYPSGELLDDSKYLFLKFEEKILHDLLVGIRNDASLNLLDTVKQLSNLLSLGERIGKSQGEETRNVFITEEKIKEWDEEFITPLIKELISSLGRRQ